ncbi:hypothetical protein [Cytobacillus firmus]|nr:hypothetical protein [Cytobacillus firmus]
MDHQQLCQQLEGYEITQELSPEWVLLKKQLPGMRRQLNWLGQMDG